MGDTDHLTPEAVKDMMHHHEKGRADNDTGFTRLELNSLALARDWRRDNPRCACGACDGLTMVSEGYHPEPPTYRCAGCLDRSRREPE